MSTSRKLKPVSQKSDGSFTKSVLSAINKIGVSESTKSVSSINPSSSSASKVSIIKKRETSRKIPRRVKHTSSKFSSKISNLGSVLSQFSLENVSKNSSKKQPTNGSNKKSQEINTEKPQINLNKINNILLELVNLFINVFIIKCDIQKSESEQMPFYYIGNSDYKKCGGSGGSCINILGINRGTQSDMLTPIFSKFSTVHTGFIQYKQRFIEINYNPFFKVLNILNIIFHNKLFNNKISDDNIEAKLSEFRNTNIKDELKDPEYNGETHLNIIITNIIDIYINIYNCICRLPAILFNFDVNLNNTFTKPTCATASLSIIMMQILTRFGIILAEIDKQINKLNTYAFLNEDKLSKVQYALNLCRSAIKLVQITSYGTVYDFYRLTDMCSVFNKIDECNKIQLKEKPHIRNPQKGGKQQCNSISSDIISFDIPETSDITIINALLTSFVRFAKYKDEFNMLFLPKIKTEADLNKTDNIANFIDIVDAITFIRTYTADFITEYGQYSTSEAIKQKMQATEKQRKKPLTNKVKLRLRSFLNKLTRKKKYDSTTSSTNKSAVNTKLSDFTKSENKYNPILYTEILPKVHGLCGRYISEINRNIPKIERIIKKNNSLPHQIQTQLGLTEELEELKDRYNSMYNNLPTRKLENNKNIINNSKPTPDIRENIKTFIALVDLGYMLFSLAEKFKGEALRKIGVKLNTSGNTSV